MQGFVSERGVRERMKRTFDVAWVQRALPSYKEQEIVLERRAEQLGEMIAIKRSKKRLE